MSSVITDPPNAFFTATSKIGFIAGAGIVVCNSIILVDSSSCGCEKVFPSSRPSSTPARCGSAPWLMGVPALYYMANRQASAEPVSSAAPIEVTAAIEPSSQESCFGAGTEPAVLRMRA